MNRYFNFDDVVLDQFSKKVYKETIINIFKLYKKCFQKLFEHYNERFKKIFDIDLFHLQYYLRFLELMNDELNNINDELLSSGILKIKNSNNIRTFFVKDEDSFNIKTKKKGNNIRLIAGGIVELLDTLIFSEARYFIDVSEFKSEIYPRKYYRDIEPHLNIYYRLKSYNKKKFITSYRDIFGKNEKSETANSLNTQQQYARKIVSKIGKLKENQKNDKVFEKIINELTTEK